MKHVRTALAASAVVILGLSAASPLFTDRLPWAADSLIHFYRLVELDHLLRQGYLFPRFAPDLAYGFGFPVFNFYAPLSYYVAMVFRLMGLDFAPALLATFGLFILCAGLGMYAWAAEVWNHRAGLVAAAAYVTAPYLLYNVFHRGALAEVLAMALMPCILWAITCMARTGSAGFFALTALLYAALLFGHNITALVFTPVIGVYALLVAYNFSHGLGEHRGSRFMHHVVRLVFPLGIGLGLSAFFLIPAFLERNSVQVIQLYSPQMFDYHNNFVSLGELLSPPLTVDPNLLLPPTPRSIGLLPLALAVLALVVGWKLWRHDQQRAAGFAGIVMFGSIFLMLSQSVPLWDALTILRFIQFPWRFLGLASLAAAFLAGGIFCYSESHSSGHTASVSHKVETLRPSAPRLPSTAGDVLVCILVVGLVVYGFAWQYVPYLDLLPRQTVADIARYERESGALGTTSAGDFMPNTVKKLPDPNTLTERYARSAVIERLDQSLLPPGATVVASAYRPLSFDVTLDSPAAFSATFDTFYFTGWQAQVDGKPVSIAPTDPQGLISLPVPAGRHRVQVWFGSTPLRLAMGIVSLLSALALIALVILRPVPVILRRALCTEHSATTGTVFDLCLAASIVILVVGLLVFKVGYLDTRETVFRRTRFNGTRVERVAHPLSVNFENQMALMGYDPESLSTDMGSAVSVALYWRALQKLDADYSISVQLVDERGFVYGQRDSQHPGGYPTSRWRQSDYARDVHAISLAPGTPPGEYRLRVGVYRVGAPSGLSTLDVNGAPSGTLLDIATVTVKRPTGWLQPQLALPLPKHLSGATLAPGLVLLGYDFNQAEVTVADRLYWTLYWKATAMQSSRLKARVQFMSLTNDVLYSADVEPIGPQFAVSRMLSGDVMRGPGAIRIPASIPGGILRLRLALVNESGIVLGDVAELGTVMVRVPERTMTLPTAQYSTLADLGPVRLVGDDLSTRQVSPGKTLAITLYWQALSEMSTDYKSFVHLLDASGRLVAGSDAVPANWTRPTTGWLVGEYVADVHTLTLPADLARGEYLVEVGMYGAESGKRLGEGVLLDQQVVTVSVP